MTSRNQPTTNLLTTQDSFTLKVAQKHFPTNIYDCTIFAEFTTIGFSTALHCKCAHQFDSQGPGNTFQSWTTPLSNIRECTFQWM